MSLRKTALGTLIWGGLPLAGLALGAVVGAFAGSMIGDAMGSPEGEGFIGFLYGLYIGSGLGLVTGVFAAWRVGLRRARSA